MEWKIKEFINEETNYPEVPAGTDVLVVDFSDNNYINSLGIAAWTRWLSGVDCTSIQLKCVSSIFMQQIATIRGMVNPKCLIESFKLPIYSEELQQEKEIVVKVAEDIDFDPSGDVQLKIPLNFDGTDDWEIDILNDQYFDVVRAQIEEEPFGA